MDGWTLHWLEAAGPLGEWRTDLLGEFHAAYKILSARMRPPRVDILIQKQANDTIPETGTGGRGYSDTLLSIAVDPENPNFQASLQSGEFRRGVIHEVHHCLRNAGPGYGWTLGEALVSEGLAGQFVRSLFGNDPELWEKAVTRQQLQDAAVDVEALTATDYDHSTWFFGSGSLPRWFGYSLGYEMVGSWQRQMAEIDAQKWVNVSAAEIIEAAAHDDLLSRFKAHSQ